MIPSWRSLLALLLALLLWPGALPGQVPAPSVRNAARLIETNPAEAALLLQRYLREYPNDPEASLLLGRAFRSVGRVDEAVPWLEAARDLDPTRGEAHFQLGLAYHTQADSALLVRRFLLVRRARQALQRAVRIDPGNLSARLSLVRLLAGAPPLLGGNRRTALREALALHALNSYHGTLALAHVYTSRANHASLVSVFQRSLQAYPDSTRLYHGLADAYLRRELPDSAVDALSLLLRRQPRDTAALFRVGTLAATSGARPDAGIAALKRFLTLSPSRDDPRTADAHWYLGLLYAATGEPEMARVELMTTLRLDPRHEGAQTRLRELGRRPDT